MNTAVIDDSVDEARQLADFISAYCSDTHACQQTIVSNTAANFLRCRQRGSFDLILIDIFPRNETPGIRIAERVRKGDNPYAIVLTIGSTDLALKDYEVRALDYVIKPIHYEKFCQTMEYFMSMSRREQSYYIRVEKSRIMLRIPIDLILYTDYSNHYIQIHLSDKAVHTYMRSEEFPGILLIYSQFICCYQNCIINVDKVFSMKKSKFTLTTGEHLPITRTIRSQIRQQYADCQFSKLDRGV